jgi:polyisoprenoid-binding protein YceI
MSTPTDERDATTGRSRRPLLIGALVVVALVIGALWWFFLRDDAPDAFDIDDAVAGATGDDAGEEGDEPGVDAPADTSTTAPDGVDGTWIVDPTAGAEAGGSAAGFRVAEELATVGATEAVGRTTQVTGSLTIAGTTVRAAQVEVDMASLQTDDARRDGRMRAALATDQFPTSTFVLTEPIELGAIPAEGETISVAAIGDLTIKGVTNPVEVALDAQVVDSTLVVVGAVPVVFADYGVEAPTAAIVVSVADQGTIELQLFLTRG